MAKSATEKDTAKKGPAKAPISSHPAFPAIVALWFAALLGLGSLILPTILLERLTVVTGIASLVPSAAPPLGFTARAILALCAALAGAATGLFLARQVAKGQMPEAADRFSGEAPARRPISAHDELGEEGLAPAEEGFGRAAPRPPVVQKRRALAIAEDGAKSEFLNSVPLPGHDPVAADEGSADEDALELADFADPSGKDEDEGFGLDEIADFSPSANSDDEVSKMEVAQAGPRQEFVPFEASHVEPAEPETTIDEEAADALPFSAPSLRRKSPALEMPAAEDDELDHEDDMPDFSFPTQRQEFSPSPAPEPEAYELEEEDVEDPEGEPAVTFARKPKQGLKLSVVENDEPDLAHALYVAGDERPLDDLGLVQLAARLGASIERRRAQRAARAAATPAPRPIFNAETEDFDAAAADEAARARASFFGASDAAEPDESGSDVEEPRFDAPAASVSPAVPQEFIAPEPEDEPEPEAATAGTSFGGYDFDEDDDDEDIAASFSLPSMKQASLAPDVMGDFEDDGFEADDSDDEVSDEEDEYSSLLTMKNPFQRQQPEFVRIDEPEPAEDGIEPTVTFPSAAKQEAPEPEAPAPESRPFDPPAGSTAKRSARDQGDAERELRAALETLQRMSGAA